MRHSAARRDVVFGLLSQGWSAQEVARRTGVHHCTIGKWAKLAGVELRVGRRGGAVRARLREEHSDLVEARGRLSLAGRTIIQIRHQDGWSLRRIAAEVGVAPSTVSRELARGAGPDGRYRAQQADVRARQRRARPKTAKLVSDPRLRALVVHGLTRHWSPRQISRRLRLDHPDRHDVRVSHETIYQALYVQGKGSLRAEIAREKVLRSGRTHRIPRSRLGPRNTRGWIGDARITARPAEVEDRAVWGHWEGDLVVGKNGQSAIITLVERSTRFVLLGQIDSKTTADVTSRLQQMITTLPHSLRRSITWDQGTEMSDHARFTVTTGVAVFFCDPHSPWQRGTNENTNGLVREFFPKGTDFTTIAQTELDRVQHLLNTRPRQTLDWHTPAEKLDAILGVAPTD